LPQAHAERYVKEYQSNRSGQGALFSITAALESWMHRKVAAQAGDGAILELGAGTLNHLQYEPQATVYDVVEPFRELWESSVYRRRVRAFYDDIRDVPEQNRYQRIIAVAVLEHLEDLPGVVAECGNRLTPEGHLQIGIPTEGGALWGTAWRCTTGVAYRLRTGLDYGELMRHEHVNTAKEIVDVLRYFFGEIKVSRFPLPAYHLSFYTSIDASGVRRERCSEFIRTKSKAKAEVG
jgi:SAM-dependent methyltransferase